MKPSKPSKPLDRCPTGSWRCQSKGRGKPSLSFSTGPKVPDAPFKCFKPSKPAKPLELCPTGSWSCQLRAVASQVFLFLLAWNCRMLLSKPALGDGNYGLWQAKCFLFCFCQTRGCGKPSLSFPSNASNLPNPPKRSKRAKPALGAAKLAAVASQVFLFLLARNFRMLPSNALNRPNPPKPSKPLEPCPTASWSCQTRGPGKPSLSFSAGPKLPDAPFKEIITPACCQEPVPLRSMRSSIRGVRGSGARKATEFAGTTKMPLGTQERLARFPQRSVAVQSTNTLGTQKWPTITTREDQRFWPPCASIW